jgi:metal-dependent hydrolase (beta-lactamase superfamily II)
MGYSTPILFYFFEGPGTDWPCDCVVWSHWHWDHTGDPSRFPKETKLIVGPGFKKAFVPALAFPGNADGVILESDYEGRELMVCWPTLGNQNP